MSEYTRPPLLSFCWIRTAIRGSLENSSEVEGFLSALKAWVGDFLIWGYPQASPLSIQMIPLKKHQVFANVYFKNA